MPSSLKRNYLNVWAFMCAMYVDASAVLPAPAVSTTSTWSGITQKAGTVRVCKVHARAAGYLSKHTGRGGLVGAMVQQQ